MTSTELPFDTISVGFYDFIVPVKTLSDINKIKPNFSLLDSFCARMGVKGVVVFCMETFDEGDTAYMRYLVPSLGLDEEPVSGASAGSLGCYLIRHRLIEPASFSRIIVEQGYRKITVYAFQGFIKTVFLVECCNQFRIVLCPP